MCMVGNMIDNISPLVIARAEDIRTNPYFSIQGFLKFEEDQIMSIRELTSASGERSKANQLENVTNFLESGIKSTRSIARNGNARTITSTRNAPYSSTVSASSITKRRHLS